MYKVHWQFPRNFRSSSKNLHLPLKFSFLGNMAVRAKIDQVEQHRYNLRPIGGRDANLADLTSIG